MDALLQDLFTTEAMREVFAPRMRVQRMLDFEAALARAEARCGVIPAEAAELIGRACVAEDFDLDALGAAAVGGGNLAIPLVAALTARVAVESTEAAGYVHWGATSQDVIDTSLVLQLREALRRIGQQLMALAGCAAALADAHRGTVMAGRTLLQQALPVTFGLKAAGWLDALIRHQGRISSIRESALALQFGGAAGTLASLGESGPAVATALAEELQLALPALPWHAQRDRLCETATTLGLLTGSVGKIARDVALMMQTELGEVLEPGAPGKGGSSTMPHKRNPVGCTVAVAAATRVPGLVSTMLSAMLQEHERGAGGWHAEWDTLPEIVLLASGALAHMTTVLKDLEVHPLRMRENLDATHGLLMAEAVTMALAPRLGRGEAHRLVEAACRRAVEQKQPLLAVLVADAHVSALLTAAQLEQLLQPQAYLGSSHSFIDAVLKLHST
ncbi:MAG: 3-carboxy-cis,cis-muconate cycloisomerase [Nevskia sp.]|nr:3-carboxy-cis,cis-muconate cycloisomerase [Nevskia sp.]